ncbi:MAG: hypothetical protein JXA11_11340 [Phycisphaerae bacterium]|nr:hypothetical protein [Phycisphaerae bacterium]
MFTYEFPHGNPHLPLPSSSTQPRQVIVTDRDTAQTVWRSRPLCNDRDSVRVDVWDGEFLGPCRGGCLLPQGFYEATFLDAAGGAFDRASLRIAEKQVFSGDLTKSLTSSFASDVEWRTDGQWRTTADGISAENERAFLFVDGAMHGCLRAEFVRPSLPAVDATWGLIVRHYNAFSHLRLLFTHKEGRLHVRLVEVCNKPPDRDGCTVLDEAELDVSAGQYVEVAWSMNGSRHDVAIDGKAILNAQRDLMGGVTVMGLFADPKTAFWQRLAMTTTRAEPTFTVRHDDYEAVIRPGNIHQLRLLRSGAPEQNLFWESGIQFGHIGGSEIKFSQSARLDLLTEGPAVRQVRWRGPMPKFVERDDDVRGWSHGLASFYPDKIVLADYVVPWVRRSVGPDFDLLAGILDGPAKIAPAGKTEFLDWSLPEDGQFAPLPLKTCRETFPLAAAFPFRLGEETWWLIAVIGSLLNVEGDAPAALFAWRDPHGLTASHDFRVSPTTPGTEYGYSILTTWRKSDDFAAVAEQALHLRDEWLHPMQITAAKGTTVCYSNDRENPAEAIGFEGCFDRATGAYVVQAEDGELELHLDPGTIRRESVVLRIRTLPEKTSLTCRWNDAELQPGEDYLEQVIDPATRMLILRRPIDQPAVLRVESSRGKAVEAPPIPASDARVLNVDFENYADGMFGCLDAGVRWVGNPFTEAKQKQIAVLRDPAKAFRGNRCGYVFADQTDQEGNLILQPRYDAPLTAGNEVVEFMFRCVSDNPVDLENFILWSARHLDSDQRVGVILLANGSADSGIYRIDVKDAEQLHPGAAVNLKQDEWLHVVLLRDREQRRVHVWVGPTGQETWLGAYADLSADLPSESIRLGDMHENQSRGSGYWDDVRVGGVLQPGAAPAPPETFRYAGKEKPEISYPVTVGEEKQLFVDDVMIESLLDVTRTRYSVQKHPDNPILVQEKPWETQANCILPMNLFRDEQTGKLRLWYSSWGKQMGKPTLMCHAESEDGLHWTKPSLGIYSFEGSTENNILREGRMFRVQQDPRDPDPSRRYKAAIRTGGDFTAAYSSDGLRWRLTKPVMRQGQDASAVFWDAAEQKWIFSCKIFIDGKRARGYAESRDFEHWTDTYPILQVDDRDGPADELYGFSILRYESVHVGLLKMYHTDTGLCDVQLAFSRNGKHWLRENRTPFIPGNPTVGAWDYGNIDDTGFPVRMGDELWFYYAGRSVTHNFKPNDGAMGLGTLRLDGFVSLDASDAGGVVTTQPVQLTGETLYINADADGGEIQVEILEAIRGKSFVDEVDTPVASFLKTDCIPVSGDGVRLAVRWKDQPSLNLLNHRPVRLRFHMKNAKLFSFWTENG